MFFKCVSLFIRFLLSLRYRIKIRGLDLLQESLDTSKGTLFMPNHPAMLDPVMIMLYLWPTYRMRPLVIEYIYRQPILSRLMKLVRALPIPNFEASINEIKLNQAEESLQSIIQGLKNKESFLLYPSGRLKQTGKETIGGTSSTYTILQNSPDVNVVMIRTSGFWGSRFSRALTQKSPDAKKVVLKSIWDLCKNLFFFMPRRRVTIEIEVNPYDFPFQGNKIELNRYLENWYNQYPTEKGKTVEEEPLNLVSYCFYYKDLAKVTTTKKKKVAKGDSSLSEKDEKIIKEELHHISQLPVEEINPDMDLALDLGLDSLDIANLIAFLSHTFNVRSASPEHIQTVEDLFDAAQGLIREDEGDEEAKEYSWPVEENRPACFAPTGKNIVEAFLRSCHIMKGQSCCADDMIGVLSYRKALIAVLALSDEIKKMKGKQVGILLPASVGAYLVILAVMMAKKVPVMLNWTLGKKHLNETANLAKVETVVSSWRFIDRLSNVEFGELAEKILFMEDVKREISLFAKLKKTFLSFFPYKSLLRYHNLQNIRGNDKAVILFTSGTETTPKGVPLTHKNIISNLHGALQCIQLSSEDVLFGVLPPFHSFGFSVAGLFPILSGIKVAFAPDPTDGYAIAKGIEKWEVTIFCSPPSFLKNLLTSAEPKQLKKLHLIVTGAEKTPDSLKKEVERLGSNKSLLEGYGITECAPVISINRENKKKRGVGEPIPGVEVCTIHPETGDLLPEHAEGEFCIHGPNVFPGYLGKRESPFVEIDNKRWYKTGDLGYVDKQGNLIISGRLKRFAKIGGEMISLGAVEETLKNELQAEEESIALCVNEEDPNKASLILFTTLDISVQKANEFLKKEGFSRLVKITAVEKLQEIPKLGTGKIDYRTLQSLANQV